MGSSVDDPACGGCPPPPDSAPAHPRAKHADVASARRELSRRAQRDAEARPEARGSDFGAEGRKGVRRKHPTGSRQLGHLLLLLLSFSGSTYY